MDFSITRAVPESLIKAICATLINSLWLGLILAAVTGLIIICTRKSAAAMRYNLLIAVLFLFSAAMVLTFISALNRVPATATSTVMHQNGGNPNSSLLRRQWGYPSVGPRGVASPAVAEATFTRKMVDYFNSNSDTVVLIWFLFVFVRCIQLIGGLQSLYFLRRRAVFQVDEALEGRVRQLALKLGLRQMIRIAESGIAKVPMVIGHLKPLILIPAGLLTAMAPAEIEAILVHELAHIRRRDYLVNLLQSLVELIFFFNPAVLWISSLIRTERENCCDDIAVAQSSSKVNYIKGLVACQEYNLSPPSFAMAMGGRKNYLTARVKRIISNSNQSLNKVEKSVLAVCLVSAALLTAAFSKTENAGKLLTSPSHPSAALKTSGRTKVSVKTEVLKSISAVPKASTKKTSTLSAPKLKIFQPGEIGGRTSVQVANYLCTTYLYKKNGILYQLNLYHGALNSVQVDGKTIPADKLPAYQVMIGQLLRRTDTTKRGRIKPADPLGNTPVAALHLNGNAKSLTGFDSSAVKLNGSMAQGQLGSSRVHAMPRVQSNSSRVRAMAQVQKLSPLYAKLNEVNSKAITDSTIQANKYPAAYQANAANYKDDHPDSTRRGKAQNSDHLLIADLIADGIINSKDGLSFKLSTGEFIVNGKKQPDDIYKRYRAKYVKVTGHNQWTWYYNYNASTKAETNHTIQND